MTTPIHERLRDEQFLARIEGAYRGTIPFDDAVHLVTGDSDSHIEIARLQRRVYSGTLTKQEYEVESEALQRLEEEGRRAHLDLASAAARVDAELDAEAEEPDREDVSPESVDGTSARRRGGRMAFAAAGVAVGVILTLAIVLVPTEVSSPSLDSDAPAPARTPTPASIAESSGQDALRQYFDTQQTDEERTAADFGSEIDATSVRSLNSMPGMDTPAVALFAAKRTNGQICLVAVPRDGQYSMSCIAEREFPDGGLVTGWSHQVDGVPVNGFAKWSAKRGELEYSEGDPTAVVG